MEKKKQYTNQTLIKIKKKLKVIIWVFVPFGPSFIPLYQKLQELDQIALKRCRQDIFITKITIKLRLEIKILNFDCWSHFDLFISLRVLKN